MATDQDRMALVEARLALETAVRCLQRAGRSTDAGVFATVVQAKLGTEGVIGMIAAQLRDMGSGAEVEGAALAQKEKGLRKVLAGQAPGAGERSGVSDGVAALMEHFRVGPHGPGTAPRRR